MTTGLQPFLVSEFKSGLTTYYKPWARPIDSYEPMNNAFMYRGVINQRNGYSKLTIGSSSSLDDSKPVMAIMNWVNESTGATRLIVNSTRNSYLYDDSLSAFNKITEIANSPFWNGTATGTINPINTWFVNLGGAAITITAYTGYGLPTQSSVGTATANGILTNFTVGGIISAGSITYATGLISLTFAGSTAGVTLVITSATTTGDYFTGNNTNFFNWTNWQAVENVTSYLYMTNNADPVTLITLSAVGVPTLSRPIFYIDAASTIYVSTCLDIKVYKNRLMFIYPTTVNTALSNQTLNYSQSIFYSALFNPSNFIQTGGVNGDFLSAPTGDLIVSTEFLRDVIVCFFTNSTWIFKYTGSDFDPFRFTKTNISRMTNTPYGTVAYDESVTSVGPTGLIRCDGVNVDRYDEKIIDYYANFFSAQYFSQSFGQRYDKLNQAWLLYVSENNTSISVGGAAPGSDQALIYNYLEDTWSSYIFFEPNGSNGLTCLGNYKPIEGSRWSDFPTTPWSAFPTTAWSQFSTPEKFTRLIGGDLLGNVYLMDDEDTLEDNGEPFIPTFTTTRWNPFVSSGKTNQFGYIDVYYKVVSDLESVNPIYLDLNFYVDNSNTIAATRTLTLTGTENTNHWKRVYLNLIGQFIQIEFTQGGFDPAQSTNFEILGVILWAKQAGRLTP
jgi:hypothetical protein